MNEAPGLEVPQPLPTFTGNPFEKALQRGGADHPTATELKAEPTPRQTCWRMGGLARPLSAPHSSWVATSGLFFPE